MRAGIGGGDVAEKRDVVASAKAKAAATGTALVTPGAAEHKRVTALMEHAQRGDTKAMQDLRLLLMQAPDWEQNQPGPATCARRVLLEATLGKNLLVREAWERRAEAMEKELAGPNPTPLERTLCERIASCWLDVQLVDLNFAAKLKESMSIPAGDYYQRRQDRAHARYLTAVQALARVRRLLAPVVAQVNIAQPGAQQLNVATVAPVTNAISGEDKSPESGRKLAPGPAIHCAPLE